MSYESWTDLLADPNMQQWMGTAGQKLQAGEGFASALNPTSTIRNMQFQKAVGGWPTGKVDDTSKKASMFDFLMNPTPENKEGPNKLTMSRTADGSKMVIDIPSNPGQAFKQDIPPEAIPAQTQVPSVGGGVSDQRPFWDQLLGMEYPLG